MPLLLTLCLLLVPALSRAQASPPLESADDDALLTRLQALGQQEWELQHDERTRRFQRRSRVGIVFGAAGVGAALLGWFAAGLVRAGREEDFDAGEKARYGAAIGSLTLGGLASLGVAVHARLHGPHYAEYRALHLERRAIYDELQRRRNARWELTSSSFTLRF